MHLITGVADAQATAAGSCGMQAWKRGANPRVGRLVDETRKRNLVENTDVEPSRRAQGDQRQNRLQPSACAICRGSDATRMSTQLSGRSFRVSVSLLRSSDQFLSPSVHRGCPKLFFTC